MALGAARRHSGRLGCSCLQRQSTPKVAPYRGGRSCCRCEDFGCPANTTDTHRHIPRDANNAASQTGGSVRPQHERGLGSCWAFTAGESLQPIVRRKTAEIASLGLACVLRRPPTRKANWRLRRGSDTHSIFARTFQRKRGSSHLIHSLVVATIFVMSRTKCCCSRMKCSQSNAK